MHRIDTKTAQKDKFGAGKNGFTRGNPQTGTPATDLDDDYFDMLQEELCSVVEASGASLEKARHDQLLTALRALLLSRKNPFGDIKSDGTVKKGINFRSLTDSIDTSSPMGRFFFHAMGALAEMERELIVERTRAGLAAAREEGRIGGRRSKLTDEQWAQAGRLVAAGESRQRVALIYDVGISTLYKKFPATR
ncbi:TPA: recombinase family protein [Escherichia coli]|nr:recombinase family protein [Escherichia coli]